MVDTRTTFFVCRLAFDPKTMVQYKYLKAEKAYSMVEGAEPRGSGCSIAMGRKPERNKHEETNDHDSRLRSGSRNER